MIIVVIGAIVASQQPAAFEAGRQAGQAQSTSGASEPEEPAPTAPAPAAGIGEAVSKGNWEVTVLSVGSWEDYAQAQYLSNPFMTRPEPQGKFVAVELQVKYLHSRTSNFGMNDLTLTALDIPFRLPVDV